MRNLVSLELLSLHAPVTAAALPWIGALPSLRELYVNCDNIRGPGLAYLSNNQSREFIELGGDGLRDRTLRHLEGLPSLRSLILNSAPNITDGAMAYLARLSRLEELKILFTPSITDAGMPFLERMPNLRLLDLHNTSVTDRGLVYLQALHNLEDLTLPQGRGPRWTVTDVSLGYVATLPRLRHLNARGACPIDTSDPGPFSDEGLRALSQCRQLESLLINSGTGISDAGIGHISTLPRLERLGLMCTGATNEGMARLGTIASLKDIFLWFPYTDRVTVAGLNELNKLTRLTNAHITGIVQDHAGLNLDNLAQLDWLLLDIRGPHPNHHQCLLTDQDLAALARHPRLKYLGVGISPLVTDAGIAQLGQLKSLERLFVGGEQVTDQGLASLTGLTDLCRLTVSGNFTDAGLRQLAALQWMRHLVITCPGGIPAETEAYLMQNLPNLYLRNGTAGLAAMGGGLGG